MAFPFVALHRAGESKKALWLRKQRQAMTIDDDQFKDALAVIYRLPDQSAEAMEDWVRTQYLADGLENGNAQEGTVDPLWLLAAKAHTYYGDLKQAS
ncbi:hypothetical protein HJ581_0040830 [Rhodococcus opacus]|nr:hypothetical protein HJ581_0040830 [Rhodococcus opacus]